MNGMYSGGIFEVIIGSKNPEIPKESEPSPIKHPLSQLYKPNEKIK